MRCTCEQAAREARDAALEEAARMVEDFEWDDGEYDHRGRSELVDLAEAIRSRIKVTRHE